MIFMREAIELARRGLGRTAPNPCVGAVVVKDDRVVGRGFHPRAGMPHAEVYALAEAGGQARGATLYVTLEPCNHHGRTPPCTEAVIRAGIRRVVAGTLDPNPLVSGAGIRRLEEAGIEVEGGVLEAECGDLIAWYRTWIRTGRPFVIMKAAVTLDGKIADSFGDSKWISSEASRAYVHELRNRVDAVIVGSGTVMSDDPLLTCRAPSGRNPLRVVLDARLRTDPGARCLGEGSLVFTAAPRDAWSAHLSRGTKLAGMPPDGRGRLPWAGVLDALGRMGLHAVMVEGGSGVYTTLVESALVDRFVFFVAPAVLGGGLGVVDHGRAVRLAQAARFVIARLERMGDDVLVEGIPGG